MQITKELIESFFLHHCTPDQAAAVANYLEQHPAEAEQYLPKSEWDENVPSIVPADFWEKQWQAIGAKRVSQSTKRIWLRIAAAAVVITAGFALSTTLIKNKPVPTTVAKVVQAGQLFYNNTGTTVKAVYLPDSSLVYLEPSSAVSLARDFGSNTRNMTLTGEAVFKVVSDTTKPFTVISGGISTTALGTMFRVKLTAALTSVYLYEGKVVVKKTHPDANQKPAYLLPGEELSFANEKISVKKNIALKNNEKTGDRNNKAVNPATLSPKKPRAATDGKLTTQGDVNLPEWYRFNKESLGNGFDQLANLYRVQIDYDKQALRKKYFIGGFDQNKPIEDILNTIAELNRLKVEKVTEKHFVIK